MDRTETADSFGFAPVPLRARHDGWTPTRQRQFVEALAETGCVSAAARRVGMTAQTAYRLRRHATAGDFAAVWDAALDMGRAHVMDVAFERAINGVATPIFYKGEQVGERRAYNDRLLMLLLRNYTAPATPRHKRDYLASDWDAALDRLERGEPVLPERGSPGSRAMLLANGYGEDFRPDRTGEELVDWFSARERPPTSYDHIDHDQLADVDEEDEDEDWLDDSEDDDEEGVLTRRGNPDQQEDELDEPPPSAAANDAGAEPEAAAPEPRTDPAPPPSSADNASSCHRPFYPAKHGRWAPGGPPPLAQPL